MNTFIIEQNVVLYTNRPFIYSVRNAEVIICYISSDCCSDYCHKTKTKFYTQLINSELTKNGIL